MTVVIFLQNLVRSCDYAMHHFEAMTSAFVSVFATSGNLPVRGDSTPTELFLSIPVNYERDRNSHKETVLRTMKGKTTLVQPRGQDFLSTVNPG